jgi:hypothetical protein
MKIWEPKPPGTLWATPGLLRDNFTFTQHKQLISKPCCMRPILEFRTFVHISAKEYSISHEKKSAQISEAWPPG